MSSNDPLFGVSWSLAIEEWFYLLFPVLLLFFSALGASKRNSFLMTMLLFILVPIAARHILLSSWTGADIRLMTIPRLDAVFYGVAVAFWHRRFGISPEATSRSFCIGVLLVTAFAALVSIQSHSTVGWELALVALPAGFALTMPYLQGIKRLPPRLFGLETSVRKLSLWSYSMYLSHIPILDLTYAAFGRYRGNIAINLLSKVVGVVLCVGVSKLIYEHFELPLTRRRPAEYTAPKTEQTHWLGSPSTHEGSAVDKDKAGLQTLN